MSNKIKNIILDFGGVIINIDHHKVENAFRELGMADFETMFNKAIQSNLFKNLETGKITPDEFRNSIREISGLNVSDRKLDETWNLIINDYPPHRIELLNHVCPPTRAPDDGDGPVAQGPHVRQSAGLKERRHQKKVGARVVEGLRSNLPRI